MSTVRLFRSHFAALSLAAATAMTAWVIAGTSLQAGQATPQRFSATAVNFHAAPGVSKVTPVDINVKRWSTDAERKTLLDLFVEKGQNALLQALRDMPAVGNIRTPDSIAYDLRFAHRVANPGGGERISFVTDRPIGFWEARDQSRLQDYPFTVIELRIGPDGKGEGKLTVATKFLFDKGQQMLVLENWNDVPVQLQNVTREKD